MGGHRCRTRRQARTGPSMTLRGMFMAEMTARGLQRNGHEIKMNHRTKGNQNQHTGDKKSH